jgi:hypothetical protein
VACLVPAVPVAQDAPVVPVAQVAQELVSSAPVVLVAVSVPVVLVELVQVLEQELPHVPVLVLTVPPQVVAQVVAVVPVVEPLVHSVVAAESPRHVSRRERKEQSLNSARHLRLVASAFLVVMAALSSCFAAVLRLLTSRTRSMQLPVT